MMFVRICVLAFMVFCSGFVSVAVADEVRVAVGSNFLTTLNEIVTNFQKDTRHTVVISSGSSGKLYAQIKNGAPFDVFLSADAERPELLEAEGLAVKGSRFVYAVGRLTLWSPDSNVVNGDGQIVLSTGHFDHLAIANPKTAPYGRAAQQTLKKMGLWESLTDRIVQGENIGQAFQFVYSRNAQLGFVALSQVLDPKINGSGSRWDVPTSFHESLEQEAVLLGTGQHHAGARTFLDFVKGDKSRAIIERFGYGLP
ncbi:molybdate ABC transporter substrate-binding protein [Candidatus Nitrospira neomarina]|uniref:Molybdate ABC transporter substrate-binding protein n=1 Tax=Candidatus Nitrospira neomarina TaxID=3020899 RepID=A0AA96GS51_9BACT|nr:molybdate ABC transporter substrate-binding protein [Candidatus Nitrospira neomarina]WNM62546.1 molybdate ABC transporter substrate-binding protein [Candidatus Nitrospira neomarina]